jgi:hypothetical protein
MEVLTDLEALTDTEIGAVIARSREILAGALPEAQAG